MGRYIDDILQPGEKVLYSTNAHWIFFLPAIVGWIVAMRIPGAVAHGAGDPTALMLSVAGGDRSRRLALY